MLRGAGWLFLVVVVAFVGCGPAEVKPPDAQMPNVNSAEVKSTESGSLTTAEEQVVADPNNMKAWVEVANSRFRAAQGAPDPQQALAGLDAFEAFLKKHPATEPEAQEVLQRFQDDLGQFRLQIEASSRTLRELADELHRNPDNLQALARYAFRMKLDARPLLYTDPDKAAEIAAEAKAVINRAKAKASGPYQAKYDTALVGLKNQDEEIEKGRKLLAMRGEPAAPLAIAGWVNGSPLTDADLKGKVVLLDFWAIWCPGCIEEFPHLRELHEKYADKGLVIIGVTQYFNYKWDDKQNAPVQVDPDDEKVSHAEEAAVMAKFVKKHDLKYRIAFDAEAEMTQFYLANGLPHVVLIDRHGKIVVSGPGGGKEIDARLKELLGP